MAKSDVLVRMKADTSSYDANIAKASKTLDNFVQSNLTMGGVLKNGVTTLTKFAGGFSALSAVMKVAKDAFMSNEESLDSWGRVVEQSKSLYDGFLKSLNNGDISGFLNNIDTITKAARKAYDALDALGTFNAFNQINVERTRTGMTESIADYREGKGTKEVVRAAGDAYKKELEDRKRLEKEAYIEMVGKVAAENNVSKKDLLDALSGSYGNYQDLKKVMPTGKRIVSYGGGMFGGGGSYESTFAQTKEEKLGQALRQLNDTQLESLQALGAQAERTGNEIAQVDKQLARVLNGRGASGGAGGAVKSGKSGNAVTYAADSIAAQERLVSELTKKWKEAGSAVRNDYAVQLGYAQQQLEMMTGKGFDASRMREIQGAANIGPSMTLNGGIKEIDTSPLGALENQLKSLTEAQEQFGRQSSEVWQRYQAQIEDTQVKIDEFKGVNVNGAKASDLSWEQAAGAIGSVGNALQSIPDPGAKILGIIGEALANIASGFAQASAKEGKGGVWYWIAATAAGLATMVSTIQQIHSATGYASGGVIPGNSFSGDNQWVRVNAGETILNQAEAGIVASALQSEGIGGMHMEAYIDAEQLRVMMVRNSTRRHGRRSGYEYSGMM